MQTYCVCVCQLFAISITVSCFSTQQIQVRVRMHPPGNGLVFRLVGSLWAEATWAPRCPASHRRCWKFCSLARMCSSSTPWGPSNVPKRASTTSSATPDSGSVSRQQTRLHTPVMVKEVLESLDVQPGQVSFLHSNSNSVCQVFTLPKQSFTLSLCLSFNFFCCVCLCLAHYPN